MEWIDIKLWEESSQKQRVNKNLFSFFFHYAHCWSLIPVSSFPGRPIPPTSSSSLLPSAQLPSSHNPPPVSCQMPLLDSNTSHQIMDTNPDEEFSPNSYLLRACSGPQQASSSGKKNCKHMEFVCDVFVLVLYVTLQMCSFITWKLRACVEMRQTENDSFISAKLFWKHTACFSIVVFFIEIFFNLSVTSSVKLLLKACHLRNLVCKVCFL